MSEWRDAIGDSSELRWCESCQHTIRHRVVATRPATDSAPPLYRFECMQCGARKEAR